MVLRYYYNRRMSRIFGRIFLGSPKGLKIFGFYKKKTQQTYDFGFAFIKIPFLIVCCFKMTAETGNMTPFGTIP